jgi:hypothetical protein
MDVAGAAVLLLAAAIAVCLVVAVVAIAVTSADHPIAYPAEVGDLLSTVFGASIGVIATYIGLRGGPRSGPGPDR